MQPTKLLCPWNSPGKNTAVGCHSFLQGIFSTQGSNTGLWHCRYLFYHLSHQGSLSSVHIQNFFPLHHLQPHHNHGHQNLSENMRTIIAHGKDCSGLQQSSAFAPISPQSILNIVTKITLSKCKSDFALVCPKPSNDFLCGSIY